jgi:hypothetical protein
MFSEFKIRRSEHAYCLKSRPPVDEALEDLHR